jgi:hypothetical protein
MIEKVIRKISPYGSFSSGERIGALPVHGDSVFIYIFNDVPFGIDRVFLHDTGLKLLIFGHDTFLLKSVISASTP